MPRRLWVVIGPFIGWKFSVPGIGVGVDQRAGVGDHVAVGIAEIPGQRVEVAEDVAAAAGGFAVRGGAPGVVEEAAAGLRRAGARD